MRKTLTNGGGKPCIRAMFYNGFGLGEGGVLTTNANAENKC